MKNILNKLQRFESLTQTESYDTLQKMSNQELNNSQISSILTAINMKGIALEELIGFRSAMLDLCTDFKPEEKTIDLCGTGGDAKDTFNISTLASFVTAGAGVKVTKHGNYGVSSFCGSSNVLESLGYVFHSDDSRQKRSLEQANICFLHAPLYHQAMKHVAVVRRELGIKTIFNLLGPLVNPARPSNQLIGVYSQKVLQLYKLLHQKLERDVTLVHTIDGYDECSLTTNVKIINQMEDRLESPESLGFSQKQPEELHGGKNIKEAAELFVNVLNNKGTDTQKEVVIANASLAISNYKEINLDAAKSLAIESLESGAAYKSFKTFLSI